MSESGTNVEGGLPVYLFKWDIYREEVLYLFELGIDQEGILYLFELGID